MKDARIGLANQVMSRFNYLEISSAADFRNKTSHRLERKSRRADLKDFLLSLSNEGRNTLFPLGDCRVTNMVHNVGSPKTTCWWTLLHYAPISVGSGIVRFNHILKSSAMDYDTLV